MGDLLTLTDARNALRIANGSTAEDATVQEYLSTVSSMIESRIGPVTSTTYDEWYDGGQPTLVLRHAPVQSIQSVSEAWYGSTVYSLSPFALDGSSPLSPYAYSIDAAAGILTRRANGIAMAFAGGRLNVHVVYTGGYGANVPPDIQTAAKLLLRHLYASERGGARKPGSGGDDGPAPVDWGAWPSRVTEILDNYYVPGIA